MTPQTHLLLQVELDQQDYIVDVGFGLGTLTAPLRLQINIEQPTSHEPSRLIKAGEDFVLQTKIGAKWVALYRFGLQEQFLPSAAILASAQTSRSGTGTCPLTRDRVSFGLQY